MGVISGGNTVIDNGAIDANEVDTTQINNDAVTADKLADISVSAGSYTSASITVDAQGRLTAASSGAGGAGMGIPIIMNNGPASGTVSSNAGRLAVYMWGGGGGQGANSPWNQNRGPGGQGGYGFFNAPISAPFSQPYSIGGPGNSNNSYRQAGNAGGATSINTIGSVNGGSGGNSAIDSAPGNTGASGNAVSATLVPPARGMIGELNKGTGTGSPGGLLVFENSGT